jgi:hypothetical protein
VRRGSIEERLAYLKGRAGDEADTMVDFRMAVDDLRSGLRDVRTDMAALRTDLRADLAAVRTDMRSDLAAVRTDMRSDLAAVRADMHSDLTAFRAEVRVEVAAVRDEVRESRISADRRFEQMDGRLLRLDVTHDRQFMWLAGLQVASLITVAGALLGAYLR